MARTRDMTTGSPMKHIVVFSIPVILGNMLQQFYSLVDTMVIGRVEGVTAQAAVSSSGWLDWMVLSIAIGLAQGFAIEIAQRFGAGDIRGLRQVEGQSVLLSVMATAVLMLLSHLLLPWTLRLLKTPEATFQLTELYLRIVFSGLPLVMGFNLLSGFLRSVGDSRTPLVAMVTSAAGNIGMDLLFVGRFHWGVMGVAAATVSAQGVSFVICLIAVCRLEVMHMTRGDMMPDLRLMKRLMKLATPIALQNTIISIGGLVLQRVVNSYGFIFMAGYSAASRLQGLIELEGVSLSTAVATFAGQNYGAGRIDRVRLGVRRSCLVSVALALSTSAVMVLFGRPLLNLFMEDDPAVVAQVLDVGYQFLTVMSAGLVWLNLLFVYRSALQGLGDTVIPMLSGVVELGMRIGSVLLLPMLLGEMGVYLSEIMAWIGAAILLAWGYYYRMRQLGRGKGLKEKQA